MRRVGVSPLVHAWVGGLGALGSGIAAAGAVGVATPGVSAWAGAGALAALLGGLTVASARPELELFGPCLRRATHPGRAALTIDDGPHPDSTPRFLAALADAGVHATFFVLADRVRAWPALLRDMVAGGHEIALHGPSHDPRLTWLHPDEGARVLRAAAQVLVDHGAPRPRWYRPPFGATSPRMYASVALAGLEVAWCSVRTLDGVPIHPETLRARCRRVVGTDIVLLHDGAGPAPSLLPEILAEWDQRGIRAASLAEALEEGS